MGACHCNGIAESHQFTEHLCARHDRDAVTQGRLYFGVIRLHCAGDDDDIGIGDILGSVTENDLSAEFLQAPRHGIGLQVRAAHVVAKIDQNFGDAAHAAAANTNKVDALDAAHAVVAQSAQLAHAAAPAAFNTALVSSCAASGTA